MKVSAVLVVAMFASCRPAAEPAPPRYPNFDCPGYVNCCLPHSVVGFGCMKDSRYEV